MKKGYKPGPDPPAPRLRSDSFVRMLELEKMYKMRRLQQDNVSSTLTNNPPRANSPPVVANPPVLRSRRTSDYPPLSHQPQIMKANRRGAALPSLSVSIPPSPTHALAMRSEVSVRDVSPAKEEHNKTVTFSEPEDQDLSDQSSICQSPSWEKWGQKKKKKPKKGDNEKSTKEQEDTALKRRSNRLIKPAPIIVAAAKPLMTSDRPSSAVELGTSTQSNRTSLPALTTEVRVATGGSQTMGNEPVSGPNGGRPKSRGFLSGFRSEYGNVSGMRGLMGARKGTGKGADESRPVSSVQDETTPTPLSNAIRPGKDKHVQKSKKPPSIKSLVSGSENSLSSQGGRGSGIRTSSSSGHGRSQSLLSSTLNKLRGSSMFYVHPSGDSSAVKSSNHATNSQSTGATRNEFSETPNEGTGKIPREKSPSHLEARQSFDFAFSSVPSVNMEPGPDIAPRGRQPRPRKIETSSPNIEQDSANSRLSSNQRIESETATAPTRDKATDVATAQENQLQAGRAPPQTKSNTASGHIRMLSPMPHHQTGGAEPGARINVSENQRDEIYRAGNTHAVNAEAYSTAKVHEGKGETVPGVNRNDKLDASDRRALEDDRVSVGTYASTIRPTSRHHDALAKGKRLQNTSGANVLETKVQSMASERLDERSEMAAQKSIEDLISFEKELPDTLQQPLQPQRDVDYFAFFSDAYVPPVLDLQSPNEDIRGRSPRVPFPDESDEDRGSGNRDHRFLNGRTKETIIANEGARRGAKANSVMVHRGTETAIPSAARPQQTDPSGANSERSSSSTYDDSPPSPSSLTTPDSSRPQSRKGAVVSNPEASQSVLSETAPQGGNRSRKIFQGLSSNRTEETVPRGRKAGTDTNSGGWRQTNAVLGLEQYPAPPFARTGTSTATPSPGATPTSGSFAEVPTPDSEEVNEQDVGQNLAPPFSLRAQSAVDLHSASKLIPRALRPHRLQLKPGAEASSVSLPGSSPSGSTEEMVSRRPALKTTKNGSANGSEPSNTISTGAAYLQEARKTAPLATASSSRALRPPYGHKNGSASAKSLVSVGGRAEPVAKMLVECCNCHFFHDMPSRVYECIAKPDSIVEDKSLGVSASISTMVRCPWCAHGMTTQCCAGYAAVIYLQEKLHGK